MEFNKEKIYKITWNDGDTSKAIKGKIISEDSFFILLSALNSHKDFTIGKSFICSVKEVQE